MLSQLDSRYFGGLTGQYSFELAFRVNAAGQESYIIRGYSSGDRSAVTEVELEAGEYEVRMQVSGYRDSSQPKIEDVVKQNWLSRREKLIRVGLSYDLAHAKGWTEEMDKKAAAATNASAAGVQTAKQDAGPDAAPDGNSSSAPPAATMNTTAETEDSWDAPLVVGLRVFAKGTSASIKVVGPPEEVAKKDEGVKVKEVVMKMLDVDDPEKQEKKGGEGSKGRWLSGRGRGKGA